jgi:hypothetical protein
MIGKLLRLTTKALLVADPVAYAYSSELRKRYKDEAKKLRKQKKRRR